jgi:NAD(P)-dependent dehydrogenase (short-subunit alcohol dehydrogenase family)
VVSLSSGTHWFGRIDLADLQSAARYAPGRAYAQSKLAMLLFAGELQRRSDAAGWGLMSNAAHPGATRTNLQTTGPNLGAGRSGESALSRLTPPDPRHVAGPRRGRVAGPVRGHLTGRRARRLLRPGRAPRNER